MNNFKTGKLFLFPEVFIDIHTGIYAWNPDKNFKFMEFVDRGIQEIAVHECRKDILYSVRITFKTYILYSSQAGLSFLWW